MKQLNCKHYIKERMKTGVYTYKLINAEINLCKSCEMKLRKQIIEQDKVEKWFKKKVRKWKNKK